MSSVVEKSGGLRQRGLITQEKKMHFSVFIFKAASFTCVIASPLRNTLVRVSESTALCGLCSSFVSGLIFTGNRSSQLINIYFTLLYHRHRTILRCNNLILTPAYWWAFNNSGSGSLVSAVVLNKNSIIRFAAGHFWDVALFLECFTFKLQSMHILKCFL